jgi:hypothetical protein
MIISFNDRKAELKQVLLFFELAIPSHYLSENRIVNISLPKRFFYSFSLQNHFIK